MKMSRIDTRHTSAAFDAELTEVRHLITTMGALVCEAVSQALRALANGDGALARSIIADDAAVDALESRLEAAVVTTIALRAPMADDLRALIGALKIANQLERVGDQAKSIGKRVAGPLPPAAAAAGLATIEAMGAHAAAMIRDVIDAYANGDCRLAQAVRTRDAELNARFAQLTLNLIERIKRDPASAPAITGLLMIGKQLERVGDYAGNIADHVAYMVTGKHFDDWHSAPRDSVSAAA